MPENWTVEDLLHKHKSRPFNPLIANTFFRAGMIETWGRGIEKINEECQKFGVPLPQYTVHPGDIMIMFKINMKNMQENTQENSQENTQENTQEKLKPIEQQILNILRNKPTISQKELFQIINDNSITYDTVRYYVGKLKSVGILSREGSNKKGKWIITK